MRLGLILLLALLPMCMGYGQQPMDEETYDVILKLLKGEFNVPVASRTRIQRNAIIRFWRNKDKFSLDEDGLTVLFNGKTVVQTGSLPTLVMKGLEETKGSGARKLKVRLNARYTGISEDRIRGVLDTSQRYQHLQARFLNKPILKPVKAKEVQTRHQIDLVDMNKWKVWYGKATYRYILTVQDVFSRYVWLKPLKGKSSSEIANHLNLIYSEHGPPKIIQHDRGKEFHGAVRKLMQSLKVKIIQSAPYHPQSQGKVERMHRSLRKKMLYDLINLERKGVNWVSHLPVYARVLNEDPKKTLHWASPFQVYYGRKSNNVMQPLNCDLSEVERENHPGDFRSTLPTSSQRQSFDQRRSMIRQRARQANKKCMDRLILKASGSTPVSIYHVNEKILVKIKDTNHRVTKKHAVMPGTIVKRNLRLSKYKVKYQSPDGSQERWFSVADITSITRREETCREKSFQFNSHEKKTRKKLLISYTHKDHVESFISSGMTVKLDPLPDGNCQFAAMADQLTNLGIFRSPATLREEIVSDLIANPFAVDGTPLSSFVDGDWDDYINHMGETGTFGDHITLQRAAQMFHTQFLVVSTLGIDATSIVSPTEGYHEEMPTLVLGHIAEGHGDHYVSLGGPVSAYIESIQEEEMQRIPASRPACEAEVSGGSILDIPLVSPTESPVNVPNSDKVSPVTLPMEILELIIKFTLEMDMSMLGTLSRVSHLFRDLCKSFLPEIFVRNALAASLKLDQENEPTISVMKLYKSSGRFSGLSLRLKQLFSKHADWMKAWLVLKNLSFGRYLVKDIYWK